METVWVFGDQLNRSIGALAEATPSTHQVLLVESRGKLAGRQWHVQRAHFLVVSMRRFADALRAEANNYDARALLARLVVETAPSNQFLCHHSEFAEWAETRTSLRLEDFYRHQRTRLGLLMDGDQPAGGQWNYDAQNRQPFRE